MKTGEDNLTEAAVKFSTALMQLESGMQHFRDSQHATDTDSTAFEMAQQLIRDLQASVEAARQPVAKSAQLFRVITVSKNRNSFGLQGVILGAETGEAWEVARSNYMEGDVWSEGDAVSISRNPAGQLAWHLHSCEIPRRLPDLSPEMIKTFFKNKP